MKRHWLTIAASIIFLGLLAGVIYVYKFKPTEQKKPQTIFQTDISKISSVILTSKGTAIEFKNINGKYTMNIPEEVPAIQNKVQGIFQAASKINYQEIISQKESNLSQYGFENPEAIVKINTTGGLARVFQIGIQVPSGDSYYVREEGQNTVYRVGTETAGQFTQGIDNIIQKGIFSSFDKNKADKIVVDLDSQTKTFEKKNGSWWVDNIQMKQERANQLMDQFQALNIDGISPKDKYVNPGNPPILRIIVYQNGVESLSAAVIDRDGTNFNVIKGGMPGVQYYITADDYQRAKDNFIRVFQEAITS